MIVNNYIEKIYPAWHRYGIAVLIVCVFIYFASYCFLLPRMEYTRFETAAYYIYRPVEIIRLYSDTFWRLTEWGYIKCGGKSRVEDRTIPGEVVRRLDWASNGTKIEETHLTTKGYQGPVTYWYETGQKRFESIFDESHNIATTKSWYPNGTLMSIFYSENGVPIKAEKWYDNGKIMCEETFKDYGRDYPGKLSSGKYWDRNGKILGKIKDGNGTKYIVNENTGIVSYEYRDGKEIKSDAVAPVANDNGVSHASD